MILKINLFLLLSLFFGGTVFAGEAWQLKSVTGIVKSIHFADSLNGWGVGRNGLVIHTADGGKTWENQEAGTAVHLNAVSFVNENKGWAAGDESTILFTNDGGETWENQESGLTTEDDLYDVFFISENTGYCVAPNQQNYESSILYTSDAGETWATLETTSIWLECIYFADENNGWAAGVNYNNPNAGSVIHTSDGGMSWQMQTFEGSDAAHLYDACFVDDNYGWVCGFSGDLFHTTNGGETWQPQASATNNSLNNICFTDRNKGWVVGGQGILLHTTNGGITWADIETGTNSILYDIDMMNEDKGWISGGNVILLYNNEGPSGVDEYSHTSNLTIFPNPSSGVVTIDPQNNTLSEGNLYVTDLNGTIIKDFGRFRQVKDQSVIWDCRDNNGRCVPAGTYFVIEETENGPVAMPLMIIY